MRKAMSDSKRKNISPLLNGVRAMKTWGCKFFAAATPARPTFYYDETDQKASQQNDKGSRMHKTGSSSMSGDTEEEVFDPTLEYGMSILVDGKVILQRLRPENIRHKPSHESLTVSLSSISGMDGTVQDLSSRTTELTSQSRSETSRSSSPNELQVKEPVILTSIHEAAFDDNETENITVHIPVQNSDTADVSATKASTNSSPVFSQTIILPPTPAAPSAHFSDALDSDSDNYFSAESDIENLSPDKQPSTSVTTVDNSKDVKPTHRFPTRKPSLEPPASRPLNLDLEHRVSPKLDSSEEEIDLISSQFSFAKRPSVRFSSLNLADVSEISTCYSYILPTAKLKSPDWLSEMEVVNEGVHPSVVIERPEILGNKISRRSSVDILRSAMTDECTSIVLHIKVRRNKVNFHEIAFYCATCVLVYESCVFLFCGLPLVIRCCCCCCNGCVLGPLKPIAFFLIMTEYI